MARAVSGAVTGSPSQKTRELAEQPREEGSPSATVSRPGSVQRVNAVDVEMDEEAGALSTW